MKYTIRQDGKDSGPYSRSALREMWAAGAVGPGTMFRAGASDVWLVAADVEGEICAAEAEPPALPAGAAVAAGRPMLQAAQIVSVRVPFEQVLALCFKAAVAMLIVSPLIAVIVLVAMAVAALFGVAMIAGR